MISETTLSELVAFAEACDFPCTKQDLLDLAEDENATDDILNILDRLPEKQYLSETDVLETTQDVL